MKICYLISNHYKGFGGSERYSIYLAEEAQKTGHNVLFILGQESELSKELKGSDLNYKIVPMESSFNPLKLLRSFWAVRKIIKSEHIEIMHSNMLREHSLSILVKLSGLKVKVVRTFHRLSQFSAKMKPFIWFYNLFTDAYIAPTEYLVANMAANGISKNKISVISNGVPAVKATQHKKALGFVGRLAKEKGVLKLVEENLSAIKAPLILAGEGPDRPALEELSKKNANIKILGPITDLDSFYKSISVLVLPSETEVLPISILESFSCGVPVVTFDIEPLRGVVGEAVGRVVPFGDYKSLYREAFTLLDSPDLEKISKDCRKEYQEKYTIEVMWQKTESLYQSLLN